MRTFKTSGPERRSAVLRARGWRREVWRVWERVVIGEDNEEGDSIGE